MGMGEGYIDAYSVLVAIGPVRHAQAYLLRLQIGQGEGITGGRRPPHHSLSSYCQSLIPHAPAWLPMIFAHHHQAWANPPLLLSRVLGVAHRRDLYPSMSNLPCSAPICPLPVFAQL